MCFNWFGVFAVSYDPPRQYDEIFVPKAQMLYLTQIYRFSNCECQHGVFFLLLSMNRPFAVQTDPGSSQKMPNHLLYQITGSL